MKEKLCGKCGEVKPVDRFSKNRNKKDGLQAWCKECNARNCRESYRGGPRKSQVLATKKKRIKYCRRFLDRYKKLCGCSVCGYKADPAALDFHHVNPGEKAGTVSKMIIDGCAVNKIKDEVRKCIVICSNCHRILHKDKRA